MPKNLAIIKGMYNEGDKKKSDGSVMEWYFEF